MKLVTFYPQELIVTQQDGDPSVRHYSVRLSLEADKKYHVMTDKDGIWQIVSGVETTVPLFKMDREIDLEGPVNDKNARLIVTFTPKYGFMAGAISEIDS